MQEIREKMESNFDLSLSLRDLFEEHQVPIKPLYSRDEFIKALNKIRSIYPHRFKEGGRRLPTSTYYSWLKNCSICPQDFLSFRELEVVVSYLVHLAAGGSSKSFRQMLIEKEKEEMERMEGEEGEERDDGC